MGRFELIEGRLQAGFEKTAIDRARQILDPLIPNTTDGVKGVLLKPCRYI